MSANGFERMTSRELLAMVERLERAGDDELEIERRLRERLAEERASREAQTMGGLRRSTMSAADKSRFIRAHGLARYQALPWS